MARVSCDSWNCFSVRLFSGSRTVPPVTSSGVWASRGGTPLSHAGRILMGTRARGGCGPCCELRARWRWS